MGELEREGAAAHLAVAAVALGGSGKEEMREKGRMMNERKPSAGATITAAG